MSDTIVIVTNASQGSDVTIGDLGITIASAGGTETFTDAKNIAKVRLSPNLRTLLVDDAHGAGSSTLILNDGTANIAQANALAFLDGLGNALINSEVAAAGDTTTTSTSDVLVNSMTITPAAGTYAIWFTGSVDNSTTNASMFMNIYNGTVAAGTIEAGSERAWARGGSQGDVSTPFACVAVVTVDGATVIEGGWRVSTGTGTMHERCILAIRISE